MRHSLRNEEKVKFPNVKKCKKDMSDSEYQAHKARMIQKVKSSHKRIVKKAAKDEPTQDVQ